MCKNAVLIFSPGNINEQITTAGIKLVSARFNLALFRCKSFCCIIILKSIIKFLFAHFYKVSVLLTQEHLKGKHNWFANYKCCVPFTGKIRTKTQDEEFS